MYIFFDHDQTKNFPIMRIPFKHGSFSCITIEIQIDYFIDSGGAWLIAPLLDIHPINASCVIQMFGSGSV